MSQAQKTSIVPIFLTAFLDLLGIGIIIPIIPALFFDPGSDFFAESFSMDHRSILYGLLVATYPIMQFLGAPILGALSDRHGRKPMLTITLFGTMAGYLLFALAIYLGNLPLLFFSRMLPGFMGGNLSIIFSSIADVSDPAAKTRNFGLIGMAFGIGFVLGPTIGGILGDHTVVSWFSYSTPFLFTALLTGVNIIMLRFRFNETLKEKRESKINALSGFRNVAKTFQTPQLRSIFTVVLFLALGFSFFTQFFSVLLIEKFEFTTKNIGLLYGWIGLWLVFTQGFTVRVLSRKFPSSQILKYTPLLLAFAIAALLLPDKGYSYLFFIINPFVSTFQGITAPNMTTVVSEQAGPQQQGEILGINQSMQSLGQAIPPLIAGYLNTVSGSLPITVGATFVFLGWLVYVGFFSPSARSKTTPPPPESAN
ncbi:MAG: MFS transporter [Saprospirales bacterium]|nr:MFS transporter [Saprospirales bacterium]MBK8490141.1 MFS transporter [Saprospirales bacterium]